MLLLIRNLSLSKHLKSELNSLKREYVSVLQSFFTVDIDQMFNSAGGPMTDSDRCSLWSSTGTIVTNYSTGTIVGGVESSHRSGVHLYGGDKVRHKT